MRLSDGDFLKIDDLFDVSELQKIQDLFSELTGLASVITFLDGTPVTQPSNFCDLCKIIRKTDKGIINCIKSDTHIAQMSLSSGSGHVQPCLGAGLWDGAVSIIVGETHIGNWLIGQIKNDEINLTNILEYADIIGADKNEITEAYEKITVMSPEKLKAATLFLNSIVTELSQKALDKYKLKEEIVKNKKLEETIYENDYINYNRINNINQGVIISDPNGAITFYNTAIKRIFYFLSDSDNNSYNIKNLKINIFNKDSEKLTFNDHPANIIAKTLAPIENEIYGISFNDRDMMWVKLNGAPILTPNNELHEIIFTLEDITSEKNNNDNFIETIQFLEKTQNIASIGTFTVNLNENKWYGSKLLFDILGMEKQTIKTNNEWLELIHPDYRADFLNSANKVINSNASNFSNTYKIIRQKDKKELWVHENSSIIRDSEGKADIIFGILQDITDIKNAEEIALQNEEKYKLLLENVLDVYYKIDMNFRICEVSPSIKYYTDIKPELLIGQKIYNFFDSSHSRKEFANAVLKNKKIHDYCVEIKLKDSKIIPVSISASITYDKKGNPKYIEGFVRDITERKKMENLLKDSVSKFKNYIEFSPHAVIVLNCNGKYIEVNPAASRISGYSVEELLSIDKWTLISKECREKLRQHNIKANKYGLASDELTIITKSGEEKQVLIDTVKLPNQEYIEFVSDMSYHYKIENKLRQKQEHLEDAQKIARLGNAVIDFQTGKWESSALLQEIIGVDKNYDNRIQTWINIIHPDSFEELKSYFLNEVIPKQLNIDKEFKIIRQNDKEIRWLHVIGKSTFNTDKKIETLTFTLQDITERKEWTDKLYHNEALYRTTLNASPDVIVVVDLNGKVKMLSPIAKQMYGTDNIDLIIGHSITEFIAEEDQNKLRTNFSLMFGGYLGTIEYKMKRANGDIFLAEVNGDVIRNSHGEPLSLVFIIRDVTQRKQAEEALAKSKEQLREFAGHLQSIREEEKIALAREIHDDLGQMLVAMKIDMGLLRKKLTNPDHQLSIEYIDVEMKKMLDSTTKTIDIARRIMADLRSENINHVGFIDAAKMYIDNFNERFNIDCKFENDVDKIEFSQKQTVALYRILQESLNNIIKHAKASRVHVKLCKAPDTLTMRISDNGCGFNTNTPRKTNSFGLLGMKERAALLDGDIDIFSEEGKGTTISIKIPVNNT
jgi:PAS domain S-box-containing protein